MLVYILQPNKIALIPRASLIAPSYVTYIFLCSTHSYVKVWLYKLESQQIWRYWIPHWNCPVFRFINKDRFYIKSMTNPDLILHFKKIFELKVYGFFRHISNEIQEIKRIKGHKISKANFGVKSKKYLSIYPKNKGTF